MFKCMIHFELSFVIGFEIWVKVHSFIFVYEYPVDQVPFVEEIMLPTLN